MPDQTVTTDWAVWDRDNNIAVSWEADQESAKEFCRSMNARIPKRKKARYAPMSKADIAKLKKSK